MMDTILSKHDILKWLDRLVVKGGGDIRVAFSLVGREISPNEVARMARISYRMLKYLARGERKLSDRLQRVLSAIIRRIESGEIVFTRTKGSNPRKHLEVDDPKPRTTMMVKFGLNGPRLEIAKPMLGPDKMPKFSDVFKRR
jgi:hypothetical protein